MIPNSGEPQQLEGLGVGEAEEHAGHDHGQAGPTQRPTFPNSRASDRSSTPRKNSSSKKARPAR